MARRTTEAQDLALLGLRVTTGGLLMGHGAQKLWGLFGGYGLQGTAGWLESLGLKPGKAWAVAAGGGEFGSGLLTALGLLGPIGPISIFGPMGMAWAKAHVGKPIWVSSGGAELPLTNMAIGAALALAGPGRYSLDELLGIEIPTVVAGLVAGGVLAGVVYGAMQQPAAAPAEPEEARDELQAGTDAEERELAAGA